MTRQKVIAFRDKYGVRPLSIGTLDGAYLLASETCAFNAIKGAKFLRHVKPGEMVIFDKASVRSGKGFESRMLKNHSEEVPLPAWCIFEGIYFSDPRSKQNGVFHEDFRQKCGERIFQDNSEFFNDLDNPIIVPILDSGKQGGIGFQKASNLPYKEYFMRRHNAPKGNGRSYTGPSQSKREEIAYMKLDLREDKVKDKTIITVDDSIVRSTTATINNRRLREAGAKYIVNVILSPKIVDVCKLGMDHQVRKELVAYNHPTEEEISRITGADKTFYLSLESLNEIVQNTYKAGICSGCFGGRYPEEGVPYGSKDTEKLVKVGR